MLLPKFVFSLSMMWEVGSKATSLITMVESGRWRECKVSMVTAIVVSPVSMSSHSTSDTIYLL